MNNNDNNNSNKTKIAVVCGPTASGKSRLAVDIAKKFGGEVINADSMQVYRGMDIATAVPSEQEKQGIAHHLFTFVEQSQPFSVAQWLILARKKISEVAERGKLPVIAGGTGLYISSLVDNIILDKTAEDTAFRNECMKFAEQHGNEQLLDRLRKVDPGAAEKLHPNNVKRVIRALECYEKSRIMLDERLKKSRECEPLYEQCMLGVNFHERATLYERVNLRVDEMVKNGLIEEARISFTNPYKSTSAQAIGHKELFPYFDNNCDLQTCTERLKMKTRNYAKRQLTWFRKRTDINWLFMEDASDYVHVFDEAVVLLSKFVK